MKKENKECESKKIKWRINNVYCLYFNIYIKEKNFILHFIIQYKLNIMNYKYLLL